MSNQHCKGISELLSSHEKDTSKWLLLQKAKAEVRRFTEPTEKIWHKYYMTIMYIKLIPLTIDAQ